MRFKVCIGGAAATTGRSLCFRDFRRKRVPIVNQCLIVVSGFFRLTLDVSLRFCRRHTVFCLGFLGSHTGIPADVVQANACNRGLRNSRLQCECLKRRYFVRYRQRSVVEDNHLCNNAVYSIVRHTGLLCRIFQAGDETPHCSTGLLCDTDEVIRRVNIV